VLTIDASAARDDAGSFVELCTRHDGSQPLLQVEIQHPYGPPDRQPDPPVPCTDFLKESYSFHSLPAGPVAASVVQHGVTAPANEFRTVQSGDDAGVTNGLSDAEPQCLARKFVQIQAGQSVPAELPLTKKNLAGQACDR
jgi:hypothetical protein